ncbi:hypothetical protein BGS_1167 [Beggiatoa sp. SS]|nr:hypothetical protein BGS_1167 [Beggiatoa sp. SS]
MNKSGRNFQDTQFQITLDFFDKPLGGSGLSFCSMPSPQTVLDNLIIKSLSELSLSK